MDVIIIIQHPAPTQSSAPPFILSLRSIVFMSTMQYTYAEVAAGASAAEAAQIRRAHELTYPEAGAAAPQQLPGWVAAVPKEGVSADKQDLVRDGARADGALRHHRARRGGHRVGDRRRDSRNLYPLECRRG